MLSIPGKPGATCDGKGGIHWQRREFLRVGGAGLFGISLSQVLALQAKAAEKEKEAATSGNGAAQGDKKAGFGKAKSAIVIFLQGGPSHIDIWDPKPDAPDNIRGEFKPLKSNVEGIYLSEVMPKLAQQMDKATLVRSLSYTPAGLFNHTAAIYQMMTGYTPDKVSPSGQLEPPNPHDYPTFGSQVAKLRPPKDAMLPFVMLPRALQESNVIGKGGTAGFLGAAYDPYYFYKDPNGAYTLEDLALRKGVTKDRMERRASLLKKVNDAMPDIDRAVSSYALDSYQEKALDLIISGRAREAFDLTKEPDKVREKYGRHTFGQGLLMARRLVEAGTRIVQVNWPAVANGNPTVDAFDTHAENFNPLKNLHCPKLDSGLASLLEDLDQRGLLKETIVVAIGEFGRSPRLGVSTSGNGNGATGRDHWPYCYTALVAGGGVKRGALYGKSDATGSSPLELPVHPTQILATIYHALGIDPHTIVHNHLNQPKELVPAEPVLDLFG
ncbi:MAG TPA: DUF1501 domain-containing protein [Planctomycetota bacterium]|nr:DUF1501 domain-containing protein [Planctomycetota bacterium]